MAKERSYQVQANMIISERQLQRTPPVMPVEVATALSDSQFQESIQRLSRWRKAAQQVMQQAATQIAQRKKAIEQGTTWVQHSKKTLSDWVALQNDLIQKFGKFLCARSACLICRLLTLMVMAPSCAARASAG